MPLLRSNDSKEGFFIRFDYSTEAYDRSVATVISLREIIEEMEIQRDDCVSYLDPDTGEVISVTEEERRLVEEDSLDDVPEFPE